jgi:hypothetical protein
MADIPKDVKGTILLPTEKTRSNRAESEVEGFAQEGKIVGAPSPQQKMPRRRGRPRKNQEIMEARVAEEPCVRSVTEELLKCAIWIEPAGGSSREDRSRTRKEDIMGENEQEPSQQLKQSKLAITELYQENMELR